MSMLDRIRDGFKYLDKNGLNHLIEKIKLHDVHWTGTHAEYEAVKDTIPAYAILHFTDDYDENVQVGVYSTEETKTGELWIDNKPVYRRVFTNLPISSTWSQHTVDNSSQDSLVSYTILGKSGVSGDTHTTPYFDGASDYFQVAVVVGAGSINYWGAASSINAFDMVVKYTKTTD